MRRRDTTPRILSESERPAELNGVEDHWFSPILEAVDGTGRIWSVDIVRAGDSKNRKRYPAQVLAEAAPLYEGMRAFDHHRSLDELRSSTIDGLIGHYRNARWDASRQAITADLHLLPSATHVAEAFTASVEAQAAGLPPLVGISHVILADTRPLAGGIEEATRILMVRSADVVADPSAGGRVTRLVAGGTEGDDPTTPPSQEEEPMTLKELLDMLRAATAEKRAELLKEHGSVLEASGFTADDVPTLLGEPVAGAPAEPAPAATPEPALVGAQPIQESVAPATAELRYKRGSIAGGAIVRQAIAEAKLPDSWEAKVAARLPDDFTEADVRDRIAVVKEFAESFDLDHMRPRVVHVTEDDRDKRAARLLATFRGDFQSGYASISEAFLDVTGARELVSREELARKIVLESWAGPGFNSGSVLSEAITTTQWGEVLADVMNKRLVEVFAGSWADWRKVVNIVPVTDFRSQKLIRVAEYSSLPTVAEGGAYQPFTSPADEQATYTPTKKGGTDSFTYEAARNDDIRALIGIPTRFGRLVAYTIYSTVFGVFSGNPTLYDSVALFHASHGNTASGTTLGATGADTLRQKMRDQTAYGDTTRALGLRPRFLVVPNELEATANSLCTGDKALPSTQPGASDMPNLHQGMEPLVVDIFTDANDYFMLCDPMDNPTIEVGFLDGKVDPELFLQDDPRSGTPFTSDEVTWKLRSIWGYGVVDYRGFQRMTN